MKIDEAKRLLSENGIAFEEKEYAALRDYMKHCCEFWREEYATVPLDTRVKTLVVPCSNGKKDIELEFDEQDGGFEFADLLFGSFSFEVIEFTPEGKTVEETLMEYLTDLVDNKYTVLSVGMVGGGIVMDSYRPDVSMEDREKILGAYRKANSIIGKLFGRMHVAELYDREHYSRVEFNDILRAEATLAVRRWWNR